MISESLETSLITLLMVAWLLPLLGFCVEVFGGLWGARTSKAAAYMAVGCIGIGFLCSATALYQWGDATSWIALEGDASAEAHAAIADDPAAADAHAAGKPAEEHHAAGAGQSAGHGHAEEHHHGEGDSHAHAHHAPRPQTSVSGPLYTLAKFGLLEISLDYYIDSLTLVMFTMVTLIATCIHVFAIGYMDEELTEDLVDHHVHTSGGGHLHRPGRFYRFFSYMSLFCFSMLGLVIAGNIFQVFVFWELVGICSYLLIGFYVERHSASTAANKAFIVNRVGDFGFLIGLMILWTSMGTFHFDNHEVDGQPQPGLFQMVRGNSGQLDHDESADVVYLQGVDDERLVDPSTQQPRSIPYWLLVAAGLGVFGGCVGKSAQFPLQTWLPDAMEGPTPVSALVHSATMVAAGVYLAGRFFPVFTPEVLLTIAYVGCITLFVAATIAIVATDIKRVLAYSTISQLGYMMLAIGVGGWGAGLFHLVTHAFFKSLMFLASGSVIVGCHHEQEMPRMGGLRKKMPITAYTMLVGVIAICGLAIPGISVAGYKIALSGYHSKDAIVASALAYSNLNPSHFLLFFVPLVTAGITAFYMFRLWFYTFAGTPRDQELYSHVHESPWVMTGPLLVLAGFAALCALGGETGSLYSLLIHSEPTGLAHGVAAGAAGIALPSHHDVHAVHSTAGMFALIAAVTGTVLAYLLYCVKAVDPADIQRQFSGVHGFLVDKWRFDTMYDVMFVRPARMVAGWAAAFDLKVFDGILHGSCRVAIDVSRWDRRFDEGVIDGLVNLIGNVTFNVGRSMRVFQTGQMRQYIVFIAISVIMLFVLLFTFLPKT